MIPPSFFFCVRGTRRYPESSFFAGKSWALLSATHALSRWNAMSVVRVGSTGPRHGFSSSYPSWAAYYSRVPISTRAIALPHRCMCAAPRLIAQVTDTIFVDLLSFYWLIPPTNFESFKISRWDFLPRRNSMFVHFFFLSTILLNFISEFEI